MRSISLKTCSRYVTLIQVEAEVFDIQRIYEENQFLKNMNEEIKKRIEKKQAQLTSMNKWWDKLKNTYSLFILWECVWVVTGRLMGSEPMTLLSNQSVLKTSLSWTIRTVAARTDVLRLSSQMQEQHRDSWYFRSFLSCQWTHGRTFVLAFWPTEDRGHWLGRVHKSIRSYGKGKFRGESRRVVWVLWSVEIRRDTLQRAA